MYFYSAKTGGLYVSEINGKAIPADAVELSAQEYSALVSASNEGKVLIPDRNGIPIISKPTAIAGALASAEREWRDWQLAVTDGLVARHRDEVEASTETSLIAAHYTELQAYRRALRNWPESGDFPLIEHRPPVPTWLSRYLP
ncbi:phage tail protein [Pseudomonas entomophila]|uniref:phage tail assembly chaperone n=1 Tax=Pseudomonas entomophila TaxID=312306 RepID=UPI001BD0D6C4|nr:phage tail assembly chaperone [Pseudomonas entomophila]QVM90220.1 phage tail protein [Pseudomonas entomophila]